MEIKIIDVAGFPAAFHALRLPFKKETRTNILKELYFSDKHFCSNIKIIYNDRDLQLMQTLRKKSNSEAKFCRYINVYLEINAPRFFWSQYDTYKISTVTTSESTMHTILKDELTPENFLIEDEGDEISVNEFITKIKLLKAVISDSFKLKRTIKKRLPENFLQKRVVMVNYQTLRSMYFDRKNHELIEWKQLCEVIETLPLSYLITGTND